MEDVLTGLPNRRALDLRLQQMLEATSIAYPCYVALLDIDHFKRGNDHSLMLWANRCCRPWPG